MSSKKDDTSITEHEAGQVERANGSGRAPVMFVHGLWLLPSSWDRWAALFDAAGYVTLTPGWPDDPETVAEAGEHPEVFAHKSIGQVADHFAAIAGSLTQKPVIIGHSFGGLLTQNPRRARLGSRVRGDRPCAVPRRAAAADLSAAVSLPGAGQPGEPAPRGPADV